MRVKSHLYHGSKNRTYKIGAIGQMFPGLVKSSTADILGDYSHTCSGDHRRTIFIHVQGMTGKPRNK